MIRICYICGHTPCDYRCPNYIPVDTGQYCSICKQPIQVYEEYIENDYGELAHRDCIGTVSDALEWFSCEVKTMDNE